jgi:hypothetical protein
MKITIFILLVIVCTNCDRISNEDHQKNDNYGLLYTLDKLGIHTENCDQFIFLISPEKGCSSCNEQLIEFFQMNAELVDLKVVLTTMSPKAYTALYFNDSESFLNVIIDKNMDLLKIQNLEFPSILKLQNERIALIKIDPSNIDSELDKIAF